MKKSVSLGLLFGLFLCFGSAFGQCSLSFNPPADTVHLLVRGQTVVISVRLSNTGGVGFTLDNVKLSASLNDGFLVTTHNAVSGTPIPVGGAYDFTLTFNPASVGPAQAGPRAGTVEAVTTSAGGEKDSCFFDFIADVALRTDRCFPNGGDVNNDGLLSPADLSTLINCTFSGSIPCPPLPTGDLNCDGFRDIADIIFELICIYDPNAPPTPLGPCPIADVRPTVADSRDAIFVEPRIIFPPGSGSPYTSLRVSITNKDSLRAVTLPLLETTAEGPGFTFGVLSGSNPVTPLTSTLSGEPFLNPIFYTGTTPSPFLITDYRAGNLGIEPPNATPKPLWEINFDEVLPPCGTVWFDSLPLFLENTIHFVNVNYRRVPVNFVKGKLAVKGDINGNGFLGTSDVPSLILCVFAGLPCNLCDADITSDEVLSVSDVATLILGVFADAFLP